MMNRANNAPAGFQVMIWVFREREERSKFPFDLKETVWFYTTYVARWLSRIPAFVTWCVSWSLTSMTHCLSWRLSSMKSWNCGGLLPLWSKITPNLFKNSKTLPDDPFNILKHISTNKSMFQTRAKNKIFEILGF